MDIKVKFIFEEHITNMANMNGGTYAPGAVEKAFEDYQELKDTKNIPVFLGTPDGFARDGHIYPHEMIGTAEALSDEELLLHLNPFSSKALFDLVGSGQVVITGFGQGVVEDGVISSYTMRGVSISVKERRDTMTCFHSFCYGVKAYTYCSVCGKSLKETELEEKIKRLEKTIHNLAAHISQLESIIPGKERDDVHQQRDVL